MKDLAVYCIDIGSISAGSFAWAREAYSAVTTETSKDPQALVAGLATDLKNRCSVALGIECPLFVPLHDDPNTLTCARSGIDGDRCWSVHAGAVTLAQGIAEYSWLFRELRQLLEDDEVRKVFFSWSDFAEASRGLFIWEAFISRRGIERSDTEDPHVEDAIAGVRTFFRALPDPAIHFPYFEGHCTSLIGAALLRTGWTTDIGVLNKPCLVANPERLPKGETRQAWLARTDRWVEQDKRALAEGKLRSPLERPRFVSAGSSSEDDEGGVD